MVSGANDKLCHLAFRTHVMEISPLTVCNMFDLDFNKRKSEENVSVEERHFLDKLSDGLHRRYDRHFETLLLFMDDVKLPNSRAVALKRLSRLKSKFLCDSQYREDYSRFMAEIITHGYAEPVPAEELSIAEGRTWYIPHDGVYHPKKPGKIRVAFDCSSEYGGEVLNRHLLQDPDLTNNLTGVLGRFLQEPVVVSCDIESMYHQVGVNTEDSNFLRFLWCDNCNLDSEPKEYRMPAHIFSATSSPRCAYYALKATAVMFEKDCGKLAADFVRRNFYVDDGLMSVATPAEALQLVDSISNMYKKGGFNLHKYMCNNKEVLVAISPELRAKDAHNLDLTCDSLPIERTPGIQWCIESDTFLILK